MLGEHDAKSKLTAIIRENEELKLWIEKSNTAQYAMQIEDERDSYREKAEVLEGVIEKCEDALKSCFYKYGNCSANDTQSHDPNKVKAALATIQAAKSTENTKNF